MIKFVTALLISAVSACETNTSTEPHYTHEKVNVSVNLNTLDYFKDSTLTSTVPVDETSNMCVNPLPEDFCNYVLTDIKSFSFTLETEVLERAFELTFSNGLDTYECFDGKYSALALDAETGVTQLTNEVVDDKDAQDMLELHFKGGQTLKT